VVDVASILGDDWDFGCSWILGLDSVNPSNISIASISSFDEGGATIS
jgi:hypothetical protein